MLARSKEEIDRVLDEAERIRAGEDPATATSAEASPAPASGHGTQEGAEGTHPPPAPSFDHLAELAVLLCDWPFVRMAGPTAQLPEPFRSQAKQAWAEVLERYLPAVAAKSGPFGVLLSIYSMHGAGLYLAWQIQSQSSGSSGNEAQANRPS